MVILIHELQKCSTMTFLFLLYEGKKKTAFTKTVLNK